MAAATSFKRHNMGRVPMLLTGTSWGDALEQPMPVLEKQQQQQPPSD